MPTPPPPPLALPPALPLPGAGAVKAYTENLKASAMPG
jgi:hypothetical protein